MSTQNLKIRDLITGLSGNPQYNTTAGNDPNALSNVNNYISTGSLLTDVYLGGKGLACGRMHEVYGPNGCGKSSFAMSTAIQCQKSGGYVFWIASEVAFDHNKFSMMGGDPSNIILSHPESLEDCFVYIGEVIKKISPVIKKSESDAKILIVWDSVNGAATNTVVSGNSHLADGIGYRQRIMSEFCKWFPIPLAKSEVCFLIINQVSANIGGGYGASPYNSAGVGNQLKHTSSTRILMEFKGRNDDGQMVKFKLDKLRFERSHRKWEIWMNYYTGYVPSHELFTAAATYGVIVKQGLTWYDAETGQKLCRSSYENFVEFLENNPDYEQIIVDKVRVAVEKFKPVLEDTENGESNTD